MKLKPERRISQEERKSKYFTCLLLEMLLVLSKKFCPFARDSAPSESCRAESYDRDDCVASENDFS